MVFLTFVALLILLTMGLYFFQEKLIFYPEVLPQDYTYNFDHSFEEIDFQVSEGIKVNALLFKVDRSKGIVFYSHGNAGSLRSWGYVADIFLNLKYDVLVYDYRGFGKSGGSISEENLYHDANLIYEELIQLHDESRIIVYGRSIGTGIATKIASEHKPGLLILESPYYNLPDLARNIFPIVPAVFIKYQFRNDIMIKKVECPIIIFHGSSDEVIYFGSSLKLEKLLKDDDRLITIEGGHHNDLANFDVYHQELNKVLNQFR